MSNPFLVQPLYYTFNDNKYSFEPKNLIKHFNELYVFCKMKNNPNNKEILYNELNTFNYNDYVLYKVDIKIIFIESIFKDIVIINKDILDKSNHFGYDLMELNLIFPVLNISFLNIQNYIDNFSNKNTLLNFYNNLVIGIELRNINDKKYYYIIIDMINSLEDSKYWYIDKNRNIDMSQEFINRKFKYNYNVTNNNIITKTMVKTQDEDYLSQILKKNISSNINFKSNKYYYDDSKSELTNQDINNIYNYLKDGQKILFIKNLLLSRKYCHHIINNDYMINEFNKLLITNSKKHNFIKSLCMYFKYAILKFYLDETKKIKYLDTNDNIVFNIETAKLLPPNSTILSLYEYIKPINKDFYKNTINGLTPKSNTTICSLQEFRENVNIFITGDKRINIFKYFDFKKYKAYLCGSIMSACTINNHPLEKKFNDKSDYYKKYYQNSDIDIVINSNNYNTFIENVIDIYNDFNKFLEDDTLELILNKSIYFYLSDDFIKNINNSPYSIEYIKDNINDDNIINFLLPYIEIEYNKYIENNNIKNNDTLMFDKEKLIIIISNSGDKDFKINIKYKIKSSLKIINNDIEIFMLSFKDPMNFISGFHLPCVKAYYDGDMVYMTPSFVIAQKTFLNLDYNYFSSNTSPMEIINKYRFRGYGILLNHNEIIELYNYSYNNEYWKNKYKLNNYKKDIHKLTSNNFKSIMDHFYDYVDTHKWLISHHVFIELDVDNKKEHLNIPFLEINIKNDDGFIKPPEIKI